MQYLFNTKGMHIANLIYAKLYAPTGEHIGHYLEKEKIVIDIKGRYLGEIIQQDRLLSNQVSPLRYSQHPALGNHGAVGQYGQAGQSGHFNMGQAYQDVATPWLKS